MKKITNAFRLTLSLILIAVVFSGCLIREVEQPATVKTGGEFQVKLTITDKTADANAHYGAVCVLAPDDWEFVSGSYDSQVGTGIFLFDSSAKPVYGNIDSVLAPPAGMKWIKLLSDAAFTNPADVIHEATINLKVGQKTGDYNIGYFTTKNSADLLGSLNMSDEDNDNAWSDTSMNHKVTVELAVGVEDEKVVPTKFSLDQNYPNPFNPETTIRYSLPVSGYTTLKVYDILGKEIAVLVNGSKQAGQHSVQFSANNLQLTSGIYFYELRVGDSSASDKSEFSEFKETKKMILTK
ncbi:MAG: T9SS type A sorting domain-containing protein [Ignavibacteriales bacterium]|nr:T9SS type A sorting domain-containing protein [Ignavibacteriales bacterium]